jgi:hypothetical protein
MIELIVANVLGVLAFLFIFWKRLKEDYIGNQIFSSAFIVLAILTIAKLIATYFLAAWWFWLSLLSVSVALLLAIKRYRLRVFETLEAQVISLLPWLSLLFLADSIINSNTYSLVGFILIALLIILFYIFDKHYKRFTWYKSGRVGFSGLTILGLFFLIRALVALKFDNMLSFSGKNEVYFSAVLAFSSFLILFNLSRQKV